MADSSSGACCVAGEVLDNRLEGPGLLVEGLLLLVSVALSATRSCGTRLGVLIGQPSDGLLPGCGRMKRFTLTLAGRPLLFRVDVLVIIC